MRSRIGWSDHWDPQVRIYHFGEHLVTPGEGPSKIRFKGNEEPSRIEHDAELYGIIDIENKFRPLTTEPLRQAIRAMREVPGIEALDVSNHQIIVRRAETSAWDEVHLKIGDILKMTFPAAVNQGVMEQLS